MGLAPRELGGWVPTQRHDHFDADGVFTGHTVVTTESRFDDGDLADLLALEQYESEVCACGYHPLIAQDESNYFKPETHKCPVCAGAEQYGRMLRDRDEQHGAAHKNEGVAAPRPSDGRRAFMRLLTPEQVQSERENRKGGEHGNQA